MDEWERGPAVADAAGAELAGDLPEPFELLDPAEAPIFAMDRVDRQIARHAPPPPPRRETFEIQLVSSSLHSVPSACSCNAQGQGTSSSRGSGKRMHRGRNLSRLCHPIRPVRRRGTRCECNSALPLCASRCHPQHQHARSHRQERILHCSCCPCHRAVTEVELAKGPVNVRHLFLDPAACNTLITLQVRSCTLSVLPSLKKPELVLIHQFVGVVGY